ncbi:MAG: hypothetical protein ACR2PX_05460, partial [Endozoicomonas sp.]|uniref:hypothetical protein n=1 Tax=Endozoicomonas sp. TaxID=1892382 RepID=UPI003D9B98F9
MSQSKCCKDFFNLLFQCLIATAFVLIHNVPLQASDFGRSTYSDDNECPYQAEESSQQALEYFKNNTRFLSLTG